MCKQYNDVFYMLSIIKSLCIFWYCGSSLHCLKCACIFFVAVFLDDILIIVLVLQPRIDPLQLLKCLSVLLSPTGGIKSKEEVQRLAR